MVGHYGTVENKTTDSLIGVQLSMYLEAGKFNQVRDLYLKTSRTGATITNNNHYAIYQEDPNAKNFLNGKLGLGQANPSEALDVNGSVKANSFKTVEGSTVYPGLSTKVTYKKADNTTGTLTFKNGLLVKSE